MANLVKDLKKCEEDKIVPETTVLTGNFLAEEMWDRKQAPKFHVHYFDGKPSEKKDKIDLGEIDLKGRPIIYVPLNNAAVHKGLVILPSEPQETTFREVLAKIDSFALKCYDPVGKESYVKLLVRVVVGSWFLDRFVENSQYDIAGAGKFAPIIPIRGPSQSGKNRLAFVLRLLSYRPYFEMSTYRVPSLYRPLDQWQGTLVLDEADFANTNEKSELIHFLNCRATGTPISRQDPKNPRITNVFSNFGQTILTQRRMFDDNATESRCLPYYSEVTEKKLPTVETDAMLKEGLEIQNMLFFLRLQYFKEVKIDKTAWFGDVSDPRLVASLLPLMALSKFEPTIGGTIKETIKEIERLKVIEKANSEDGIIVNALWETGLFAQYSGMPNNEHYYFQVLAEEDDKEVPKPLTVTSFADQFKMKPRDLRKILNSLNLCAAGLPRVIKVGSKSSRVIFFDPPKFEKRLKEFVVDYKPYDIYDKLGLAKPQPVTEVTQVTPGMHDTNSLASYLGENAPCSPAVTSVTCVTKKEEPKEEDDS
jgi:hypothetical protein